MKNIRFLTLAEILLIHKNQVELYGGSHGLRDSSLLCSAVVMPETMFSGEYLHKDLFQMAAAYLYHICQNHAFIDGNKRVALASCLVFLDLNGIEIIENNNELYNLVIDITLGKIKKGEISEVLRKMKK